MKITKGENAMKRDTIKLEKGSYLYYRIVEMLPIIKDINYDKPHVNIGGNRLACTDSTRLAVVTDERIGEVEDGSYNVEKTSTAVYLTVEDKAGRYPDIDRVIPLERENLLEYTHTKDGMDVNISILLAQLGKRDLCINLRFIKDLPVGKYKLYYTTPSYPLVFVAEDYTYTVMPLTIGE